MVTLIPPSQNEVNNAIQKFQTLLTHSLKLNNLQQWSFFH